mgnify:CR=1 FL=1
MGRQVGEREEAWKGGRGRGGGAEVRALVEGEGTVVMAVGAAHMGGENGVVELLRESGITVERQ